MKYWEIIANNLIRAGWSWGYVSSLDCKGRTVCIADAHRGDGRRFVVRADEELTAFLELESINRGTGSNFFAWLQLFLQCPSLFSFGKSEDKKPGKKNPDMKTDTLPIKKRKNSLVPTHKVFTGLSAGTITALIVYELHTRFNIDLAPIEGSFLTVILSFAASWLAPNSPAPSLS